MTPEQILASYQGLAEGVRNNAAIGVGQINNAALAKGPSLGSAPGVAPSGGSVLPGTYNYNRLVAPAVGQLESQLIANGYQFAYDKSHRDRLAAAQNNYNNAAAELQKKLEEGPAKQVTGVDVDTYDDSANGSQDKYSAFQEYTRDGKLIGYDSPEQSVSSEIFKFEERDKFVRQVAKHYNIPYEEADQVATKDKQYYRQEQQEASKPQSPITNY